MKSGKEEEKKINNFKDEVSYLSEKLRKTEESIDALCFFIHGFEETKGEDTDNSPRSL